MGKLDDSLTIIGDSDGLIALLNNQDAHAPKALRHIQQLSTRNATIIYPITTLIETTTTLQRRLKKPELAQQLVRLFFEQALTIEPVDETILKSALTFFNPKGSKKNTLFDAIVAAVAQKYHADAIFSFDTWYHHQGFSLLGDVFTN